MPNRRMKRALRLHFAVYLYMPLKRSVSLSVLSTHDLASERFRDRGGAIAIFCVRLALYSLAVPGNHYRDDDADAGVINRSILAT